MSTPWVPTTDAEKAAKEAFDNLQASVDKGIQETPGTVPNKFILQSEGYYALKNFVMTGKDFPRTNTDFSAKMSKQSFHKLTEFDLDIYEKTQDAIVSVGSTCYNYQQNHLTELVNAGQTAIQYADNATQWLSTMEGINLRTQLNVLLDPKYNSSTDEDDAFKTARTNAQAGLDVLKQEADDKQNKTNAILQALLTFRDDTTKNQEKVHYVQTKFEKGDGAPNTKTPYLNYLQNDLTESKNKFQDLVRQANEKYQAWSDATAIAVGCSWAGVIGWIVMAVKAKEASDLRSSYDDLINQQNKLAQDNKEESDLITYVSQLCAQCDDIDGKMSAAITAMTELHALFTEQSNCYDKIKSYVTGMRVGTTLDVGASRRSFIQTSLDNTLKKLVDLKSVATEFVKTVRDEVKLTN